MTHLTTEALVLQNRKQPYMNLENIKLLVEKGIR